MPIKVNCCKELPHHQKSYARLIKKDNYSNRNKQTYNGQNLIKNSNIGTRDVMIFKFVDKISHLLSNHPKLIKLLLSMSEKAVKKLNL